MVTSHNCHNQPYLLSVYIDKEDDDNDQEDTTDDAEDDDEDDVHLFLL